jgi:hypothetical protein
MGCCLSLDAPVEVTEEKKLRVRYGLWVHDGVATREQSEQHWKRFTELPVAELHPPKK